MFKKISLTNIVSRCPYFFTLHLVLEFVLIRTKIGDEREEEEEKKVHTQNRKRKKNNNICMEFTNSFICTTTRKLEQKLKI